MPIIHSENGIPPSKSRIVTDGENVVGTVVSGAHEEKYFTPPAGKLWRPILMYLYVTEPAATSSGQHSFHIKTEVAGFIIVSAQSTFNHRLEFSSSVWEAADDFKRPTDEAATLDSLRNYQFDQSTPLCVRYNNQTDKSQNHNREIWFTFEETPII